MKNNEMKRLMKVNVTTRKKSIFGIREVVENKTIMLPGKACVRMKQEKWNKPFCSEEDRLATLYLAWEDELKDRHGEC